jgi:hypothetical protein
MEKILQFHLEQTCGYSLVRRFPYVMYCVRPIDGTTRWVQGEYDMNLGYYIKYRGEYEAAIKNRDTFQSYSKINNFYMDHIQAIDLF